MEEGGPWQKHFGPCVSKVRAYPLNNFNFFSYNDAKPWIGMSHERLNPSEIKTALKAYGNALPLFSYLQSEFTQKSIPKSSGILDFTVFYQLRELWRWVERLLWRAVVLSSRTTLISVEGEPEPQLWRWLDYYATCSSYWPATFRTDHRSTVYSLHIRALVLKNGVMCASPLHLSKASRPALSVLTPASTTPITQSDLDSAGSITHWIHSARSVVQEYRAILTASTKFPHAGERNVKVEEFVDLCVAIWEAHGASGEQAGWVIDVCCFLNIEFVVDTTPCRSFGGLLASHFTHLESCGI